MTTAMAFAREWECKSSRAREPLLWVLGDTAKAPSDPSFSEPWLTKLP